MRGSPFVKPFEARVKEWEEKLISMQEIIDEWLKCQAVWLYLEPIFSSEDIMRQMPQESKRFIQVDRLWRKTMAATEAKPNVLLATSTEGMLDSWKNANHLLELIQQGLNDYLEAKRLSFARLFFLSNDELLQMCVRARSNGRGEADALGRRRQCSSAERARSADVSSRAQPLRDQGPAARAAAPQKVLRGHRVAAVRRRADHPRHGLGRGREGAV
jgi:hypothetical protein